MDLKPEQLSIVCDILARHLPGREVQLFGSRAAGRAKPHSDIDLVIMGNVVLPVTTMRMLRDAFDDSDLPFQVDLVEWAGTSGVFRKVIASTAIPLCGIPADELQDQNTSVIKDGQIVDIAGRQETPAHKAKP